MNPLLFFLHVAFLGMLAGCSSSKYASDIIPPELLYQYPLPSFPQQLFAPTLRIPLEIHVEKDGSVSDVRIMKGSGDRDWDSSVVSTIRQWKYSPAHIGTTPVSIWVRQTAVVQFTDPQFVSLAEIVCKTAEDADSSFISISRGEEFSDIVKKYSVAESRHKMGVIGNVNIQIYPERIKKILASIKEDQFTKPLQFGDNYIIFKRLAE